jgi:hypothetical protein
LKYNSSPQMFIETRPHLMISPWIGGWPRNVRWVCQSVCLVVCQWVCQVGVPGGINFQVFKNKKIAKFSEMKMKWKMTWNL